MVLVMKDARERESPVAMERSYFRGVLVRVGRWSLIFVQGGAGGRQIYALILNGRLR